MKVELFMTGETGCLLRVTDPDTKSTPSNWVGHRGVHFTDTTYDPKTWKGVLDQNINGWFFNSLGSEFATMILVTRRTAEELGFVENEWGLVSP